MTVREYSSHTVKIAGQEELFVGTFDVSTVYLRDYYYYYQGVVLDTSDIVPVQRHNKDTETK